MSAASADLLPALSTAPPPAGQTGEAGALSSPAGRAPITFAVCRADELPPGARMIVTVAGRSIGVFNVGGRYFALRNACPHRIAPLCEGRIRGLVVSDGPYDVRVEREGEIIACPWHGWEFDITTGRSHFNPHKLRVKRYEVTLGPAPTCGDASAADAVAPTCAAGAADAVGAAGDVADDADPSVETFPVTVERNVVLLHVAG